VAEGDTLEINSQKQVDMPTFRWESPDLMSDGSKVVPDDDADYRFGIDATLAVNMKWLAVNADRTYALGPRLLLHFPKPDRRQGVRRELRHGVLGLRLHVALCAFERVV